VTRLKRPLPRSLLSSNDRQIDGSTTSVKRSCRKNRLLADVRAGRKFTIRWLLRCHQIFTVQFRRLSENSDESGLSEDRHVSQFSRHGFLLFFVFFFLPSRRSNAREFFVTLERIGLTSNDLVEAMQRDCIREKLRLTKRIEHNTMPTLCFPQRDVNPRMTTPLRFRQTDLPCKSAYIINPSELCAS